MNKTAVSITILADNSAVLPFREEHGFSAFAEFTASDGSESGTLLFDTGQGVLFSNAPASGVDLGRAKLVALSHGHYDHTNALPLLLERHPGMAVYASEKIFTPHYSISTGKARSISLSPESRQALGALPSNRLVTFGDRIALFGGLVHLSGRIPRIHPLEAESKYLFTDPECTIADTMDDETVLWAETAKGLVILTGCCHAGFINTCEHVKKESGIQAIHAVIGGFHLAGAGASRLEALCLYIWANHINKIIPCHCTGSTAVEYLEKRLGDIVSAGTCGMRIES